MRVLYTGMVAACAAPAAAPQLTAIAPSQVIATVTTPAILTGNALYASAHVDLGDQSPATLDRGWRVWLGGVELTGVTWTSPEQLAIMIPAGITSGTYDVTAVSPAGETATLPAALTVSMPGLVLGGLSGNGGESVIVATDPLGDGTPFGFVTGYLGRIVIGPNRTGTAALSVAPDRSSQEPLTFSIAADTTGHRTANASAGPYSSLGYTGCQPNVTCGPNNENGRGVLTSATIAGTEWLIAAGARTGSNTQYIYMTQSAGPQLALDYVDLSAIFAGGTLAFSAIYALDDVIYLGGVSNTAQRPRLVALHTMPTAPGLDATSSDGVDLQVESMPGIQAAATDKIDALGGLAGRLYLANDGAWARATVAVPAAYEIAPADWAVITPAAPAYTAYASRTSTATADLEPIDRAVPQMAAFGGRMFVARNTVAGPQLWSCDPALGGDPQQCDADEWSQLAGNAAGDPLLTQFDDSSLSSITMLVATTSYLYVGFDAPGGLVVFRTANPAAAARADFTGAGGCSAALHGSGGCAGYGGTGLGAGLTRIFDAKALFGSVWITAGTDSAPVVLVELR